MIKHKSRQYTKEKESELNKEGMILLPSFSPQVPQFSPQIQLSWACEVTAGLIYISFCHGGGHKAKTRKINSKTKR